jgi:hypothetical protein
MKSKGLQWVLVLTVLAVFGGVSGYVLRVAGANSNPSSHYTWQVRTARGDMINVACPESSYAGCARLTAETANFNNYTVDGVFGRDSPKTVVGTVLLAHVQRIPSLVFFDLESQEGINCVQGFRTVRRYANPCTLFRLLELVLDIAL